MLISGLTVIAAMAGMFLTGDKTFISFAEGTILVVAIAMFASVTVLPAMLAWLGDRIEKGRIPFIARQRRAGESRFWSGLVDRVMRRPWLSIALAGGALVALAIPALSMKPVVSGPDDLPQNLEIIKTYHKVRAVLPDAGGDGRRRGAVRQRARSRGIGPDRAAAPRGGDGPRRAARDPRSPTARTTRSR